MGHYKSNVRDLEFNLFEVLELEKALAGGEFGDLDGDSVRQMLDEASRLAEGPLAESFADADRHPPTFDPETHTVSLPESFKKSFRAWQQGEWFRIGLDEDVGGVPAPAMVAWAINEFPLGAQPAAFMYLAGPILANILYHIGNEQQRHWAAMAVERNWGATMVLTEPDAGSDVGAGRTKAIAAARRHLAHRRRQTVHHQRRHRRPVREHPAYGAGPARGRRTGHQGPEPVHGAEVPSRPPDRRAGRAQRRVRHRTRTQDGSQGVGHLRADVRPARRSRRRLAGRRYPQRHRPDVQDHRVRANDGAAPRQSRRCRPAI